MAFAQVVDYGSVDGATLGKDAAAKISFYGAAPVVQRATATTHTTTTSAPSSPPLSSFVTGSTRAVSAIDIDSNSDSDSMSSGTRGGSPVNSSVGGGATSGAGAISGSNSTNGSSSSSSAAAAADVEDTILIIPEMRWIGPKNLIMWPYVHLSRKASWK